MSRKLKKPKVVPKALSKERIEATLELLDELREYVANAPIMDTCNSCDHFEKMSSHCDQWQSVVPEAHRLKGCEHWSDPIPF